MGQSMITGGTTINFEQTCTYCGCWHSGVCPRIEEIEYFPDGTVKRVRLRTTESVVQADKPIWIAG